MKMPNDHARDPHSLVCESWPDCRCDGADCNPFGPRRGLSALTVCDIALLASVSLLAILGLVFYLMRFWK